MVDAERLDARLDRLEHLIERLEAVRAHGEDVYLADEDLRAMPERRLQLAIHACRTRGRGPHRRPCPSRPASVSSLVRPQPTAQSLRAANCAFFRR